MGLSDMDDDLLSEILLRLPPRPSSLPHASLICKRWRRLVSEPQFLRLFGTHHRAPPLLGFFSGHFGNPVFTPALNPPDRIPAERFSMPRRLDERWSFVGCRHGLALFLHETPLVLVWNPITGDQRRVAVPPELAAADRIICHGAVLCAAAAGNGHVHCGFHPCPFKVILIYIDDHYSGAFASVYSSESGEWGSVFSTPIPSLVSPRKPSTLVGNTLYWLLTNNGILELHLDRQSLAVIGDPGGRHVFTNHFRYQIMPSEGGELGFAIVSGSRIQLWERKADSRGVATWALGKTIDLDMILAHRLGMERIQMEILGFSEDANVILVSMGTDGFMVQLESMQVRKLPVSVADTAYHPYTSFAIPARKLPASVSDTAYHPYAFFSVPAGRVDSNGDGPGLHVQKQSTRGSGAKQLIGADKDRDFHMAEVFCGWHYIDPQGDEQGPFFMVQLLHWKRRGYFSEDFRVWRAGQTKEQSILLTDAMGFSL